MKKYYKFIFIALFGFFVFLPKDTFAMTPVSVDIYTASYGHLGNVKLNGTNLTTFSVKENARRLYFHFNNAFTEKDINYTAHMLWNMRVYSNTAPTNSIRGVTPYIPSTNGSFYNNRTFNNYLLNTSSLPSGGVPIYNAQYDTYVNWTNGVKANTATLVFDLGVDYNIIGLGVSDNYLSSTGDTTGDAINNQTQTIVDNNNKNTDKIVQSQDEIKDAITSDEAPEIDALEDSAGWLPPGPVDSILNLPLTFFNNLISNLSKTCQPVEVPLPFVNKNLTLPCISSLYEQIGATTFLNWVGLVVGTIILYNYFLNLYSWVDKTIQMEDQGVDDWGGV